MRGWQTCVFGGVMLGIGWLLGGSGGGALPQARAQDAAGTGLSEDAENKIRAVNRALAEAVELLRAEGKYNAVTDEPNAFLILSGGGDARLDLEEGNGVDPETFAALYAGRAVAEIGEKLGKDDEGRVTYNDKPVQMYSRRKLTRMAAERTRIQTDF